MTPIASDTEMSDPGLAQHLPLVPTCSKGPEGVFIPDENAADNKVAVIYDKGQTPPTITISDASACVQTIMANGIAVAVIACSTGPRLSSDDVLLVERFIASPA